MKKFVVYTGRLFYGSFGTFEAALACAKQSVVINTRIVVDGETVWDGEKDGDNAQA